MKTELIVAEKEFRDHLSSKRFLVIFAILILLSVAGMAMGMGDYNKMLDSYKKNLQNNQQQPWFQEQVSSLQKQIQEAEERGAPDDKIQSLKYQLEMLVNPPMPSVLYVFNNINMYFTLIGMVLAVSMGFDLISKEKEEGSLKSLLSHPLFRDSVINGKALGSIAMLAIALASMFLVTIAIMLFYGVVPTMDDFLRIVVYFVAALLYCTVFFAIGMMTSTIARSSAMSIMYTLGIIFGVILLSQLSYQISDIIMGPPPEVEYPGDGEVVIMRDNIAISSDVKSDTNNSDPQIEPVPLPRPIGWNEELQKYYERKQMIQQAINTISPLTNFQSYISQAIISKYNPGMPIPLLYSKIAPDGVSSIYHEPTVWESLSYVWINFLVLVIEAIVPFAISYVKFMRMDVR